MKRRFLAMLLSVAMVLTMLPVTAFAADTADSDGPVALAELTQLTVRAIKATGADGKITLKVTAAEGNSKITDFYYKTAATGTITAPTENTELPTTGNDAWTKYREPFVVTTEPAEVGVVAVTTTDDKLMPTSYGSTNNILTALGELTVTIGTTGDDADPNAIVVKDGDNDATGTIKYYALAVDKLSDLTAAKADWASDTALTSAADKLGTEVTGNPIKVTEAENGKYLVAVITDNDNLSKIGVTKDVVKFTRPFKLYAGTVVADQQASATDLIADATYENSQYAVTVPAGTEKVTVGTGATITNPASGVSGNVVPLDNTGATTISLTASDSITYTVEVSPVEPVVKKGNTELVPLTRTGSVYTYATPLEYAEDTLTVSGPEGHAVSTVTNGTATSNGPNASVDLTVGENTLAVTFDDGGKCTIKVTRNDADPAVALYEGVKASGTDLLEGLTANNGVYTVGVPSTVTQVTVGAKAGTIATVKYTPTDGTETTSNTVTLNEGSTAITVTFNDDTPTVFTINVTKAAAFVPLNVTEGEGDKAGKVVVARAEGEGEVPTGLKVVTLAKEPTWTAATTETQVDTDRGNIEPDNYNADTTTVPAASEADQYVVVYKIDNGLVVAFGVLKVGREERSITVNATDTDPGLLNFDSTIHEYTISIPSTVAKATVAAGPGAAKFTCTTAFTKNTTNVEVTADPGNVSTVTVTFTGVSGNGAYEINIVWAKDPLDISVRDQIVTATTTSGEDGVTAAPAESAVLQAISSTSVANNDAVEITATTGDDSDPADKTTVTLPASAAELLQDTGIDAKVVTDAGEVTIPSEAIAQTQPGTEDSPAAPVAIAIVVAKKDVASSTPGTDTVVEAAKFEVTVKKANAEGVMEATDITDLKKLITLVFKVAKDDIGEMKNPRLAYVKPAATVGGKPTYEKLPEAPEPTFDEATQIYTFTGKTSHLSEFAVVAEEATTEPEPTGPVITNITLTDGENPISGFEFKTGTDTYNVTVPSTTTHASVTVTADSYTDISVNGTPITSTKNTVGADIEDGEVTFEVKVNDEVKYTITVKQEDDTSVKEITNIKLTDKTGTTAVEGFTFAKATTTYTVETDENPVLVTVEGDTANVTVDEKPYTDAVEVVPTAAGTKVTIAYGDGTAQKYEITLKTKSTTPPVEEAVTIAIGTVVTMLNEGENTPALDAKVGDTITVSPGTATVKDGANPVTLGTGGILTLAAGPHNLVITVDGKDYKITVNVAEDGDEPVTPTTPVTDDKITVGGTDETIKFDTDKEDPTKQTADVKVASGGSFISFKAASGATVTLNGKKCEVASDGTVTATVKPGDTIQIVSANGKTYVMKFTEDTTSAANLTVTAEAISAGDENPFQKLKVQSPRTNHRYVFKVEFKSTADSKLGVFTMTAGEDGSIIVKTDPDGYKVSVYEFSGTNDMIVNGSVTENNRTGVNINQNVAVTGK